MSKRVLFLGNTGMSITNYRLETIQAFREKGYEIHVSFPYDDEAKKLKSMGFTYHDIHMNRRSISILEGLNMITTYGKLYKKIKPKIVFGFTIKPNIFGSFAAQFTNTPFVANITGLGTAVENSKLMQNIIIFLYKISFRKVQTVFFQNTANKNFFRYNNIAVSKHKLLPGSGVNLESFNILDYPSDKVIEFVFISRIMKEKGIIEYLKAAKNIKEKYSKAKFHIYGFYEEEHHDIIKKYQEKDIIYYHGYAENISDVLKDTHAVVHPSYHEGMANILLEAAASGRPILASNIPGCRETFDEGITGFGFEPRSSESLIKTIEKFIKLPHKKKEEMGGLGRQKMEVEFDRQNVVDAYINEINV